jgi:hypothetical protein
MATTTAPPTQPPSYGGLHRSASAVCFLWRGVEDGGTSCRKKEKWKPSYDFIPNGWMQKESVTKERKNKE